MAYDRDKWWAHVNVVMHIQVLYNVRILLTSWGMVIFLKRTLFHVFSQSVSWQQKVGSFLQLNLLCFRNFFILCRVCTLNKLTYLILSLNKLFNLGPNITLTWCIQLFNYTHQHMHTHTHTHTHTHIYILFKKSKICIKIFKTLLHVLIIRSSAGSVYCSLLNL